MTHGSNTSNHHPLHPRDDREALSALFDGQLPADAARFALKRLDHDASWRDTCGRWQLIGDALRGEATSAAPAHFAAGVMRKLAAEGAMTATTTPPAPVMDATPAKAASRRRWMGGAALAASVAMVAVLVARPFSQPETTTPQTQVASSVVTPASERASRGAEAIVPAVTPATSSSPATTLAAADASPAAQRRITRRAVLRPVQSPVADVATAVAAAESATTQKPFHPPTDEIATRPWPRAVLPDAGAGALSVGFGTTSTPAPSFYPFEPRVPEAVATKPAAAEPQR